MNRRSFMKAILAAGVAPYVVTSAGVFMPVRGLIIPQSSGIAHWVRTTLDVEGFSRYYESASENGPWAEVPEPSGLVLSSDSKGFYWHAGREMEVRGQMSASPFRLAPSGEEL